jgi:hypothetical protein
MVLKPTPKRRIATITVYSKSTKKAVAKRFLVRPSDYVRSVFKANNGGDIALTVFRKKTKYLNNSPMLLCISTYVQITNYPVPAGTLLVVWRRRTGRCLLNAPLNQATMESAAGRLSKG